MTHFLEFHRTVHFFPEQGHKLGTCLVRKDIEQGGDTLSGETLCGRHYWLCLNIYSSGTQASLCYLRFRCDLGLSFGALKIQAVF